ncbi:MAG: histidine phosphatase family protein [Acidiferrobacterales bacterium]|nr:histidine phosphatase family protein [Acidiferrobacterales bacterium]
MNNRYYVMRHGESTANRIGVIVCAPKDALNGFGLTARGAEKVLDVAVKTRLSTDLLIVSSDFLRARETAEIVQKVVDIKSPIEFRKELRERSFGDWHLSDDSHYELVWRNDLKHPTITSNGVETAAEVLDRVMLLVEELEQSHQGRTILLVGHGDVLQILCSHFNGIECRFHRSLSSLKNAEIRALPNQIGMPSQIA